MYVCVCNQNHQIKNFRLMIAFSSHMKLREMKLVMRDHLII